MQKERGGLYGRALRLRLDCGRAVIRVLVDDAQRRPLGAESPLGARET